MTTYDKTLNKEIKMTCFDRHPKTSEIYDWSSSTEEKIFVMQEYLNGKDIIEITENSEESLNVSRREEEEFIWDWMNFKYKIKETKVKECKFYLIYEHVDTEVDYHSTLIDEYFSYEDALEGINILKNSDNPWIENRNIRLIEGKEIFIEK